MSRFKLFGVLIVLGALAILPAMALAASPQRAPVQAATPTEAMMQEGTPTAEMMQEGTPTSGAMMQEGTPTAEMMQEGTPTAPANMPTTGSGDASAPLVPALALGLLAVGGGLAIRRFARHS